MSYRFPSGNSMYVLPMMGNSPTGIALRTLRQTAGLTLRDTAEIAGSSLSYISRAETGQVTPRPLWIAGLVEAIGKHMQDAA